MLNKRETEKVYRILQRNKMNGVHPNSIKELCTELGFDRQNFYYMTKPTMVKSVSNAETKMKEWIKKN